MHADAFPPERSADDDLLMPVLMALALHVALALLLVLAGWWNPQAEKVSVAGPVVQAALVVSDMDVVTAERSAEQAPKPAPMPEPEPVEASPPPQPLPSPQPMDSPEEVQPEPQEQQPEPERVDQEAVARIALEQEQAREREIQEEKRRQEQIDLTERERQAEAERRQRLRAQLEAVRREREEAERVTRMEQERLKQLADLAKPAERPTPAPSAPAGGNEGTDTDLRARYVLAIAQAIESAWIRPETISPDAVCPIRIIQIPGGQVISAEVLPGCPYDALGQRSVEAAVLRAQPLPYAGFESVFQRDIKLNFRATED